MPSAKCVQNVNNAPPPGNVWCGDSVCAEVQTLVNHHCNVNGYRPDDAWLMFREVPPGSGTYITCSCCCSCYGYDTPIEAKPGVFIKVQDVKTGGKILAAGLGLNWVPTTVSFASGMHTAQPSYPVMTVIYRWDRKNIRVLNVTDDTLFLMTNGKLKSASVLIPGDKLRRADGKEAIVAGPVAKSLAVGVHSIELGPFDGVNLDGHLINSHGVVTADFSVQRIYGRGGLTRATILDETVLAEKTLVAGTEEYATKYKPTREFLEALAAANIRLDPGAFEPPAPLITVPGSARSLFTKAQAVDIQANAPKLPSTATARIKATEKILEMARTRCTDVVMLIDWNNSAPNAYSWVQLRQRFIVISGGMLRIQGLTDAGIALIVCNTLAYHDGARCVAEADYHAVNVGLRRTWPESVFFMMCERGINELLGLFKFIARDNGAENETDRCAEPSLACRERTFRAAMTMQPVPECAGVPKD